MCQIAAAAIVVIQIAVLYIWLTSIEDKTDTVIPSGFVNLVAALCFTAIVYVEHCYSVRSSGLMAIYLFIALATEITNCRSFFLRPGLDMLGVLAAATSVLRLVLLGLQELSKRSLLIDNSQQQSISSEAMSGFLTRLFMLFLGPILAMGFRSELLTQDLSRLDPEFVSKVLYQQLNKHWSPYQKLGRAPPNALLKACLRAWRLSFFGLIFARLIVTAFNFSQPFIFRRVIEMVGDTREADDLNERLGMFGGVIFMFLGQALSRTYHAHLLNRHLTRVRGGITALLIHKEHSLTDHQARQTAAVTLMSTDMDGIAEGMPRSLQLPVGIIEVGLGIYLLSGFIGVSALTVFIPVVLSTTSTYFLTKSRAKMFARWNQNIESRVAKTAKILPQLTAIKMLGLGPTVADMLKRLRVEEIDISASYRYVQAIAYIPMLAGDSMTPVVVIASALFGVAFGGEMSAAKVFPVLTMVALIQRPLLTILETFSRAMAMLACFTRIQDFLLLEGRKDARVHSEVSGMNDSLIRFDSADIAPLGETTPLISGVSFELARGSITAVLGDTGAGKSTIVEGVLGQCEVLGGSIHAKTREIAYCSEHVWLRDTTIRGNIVGELPFNRARFNKVVRACCLDEDLTWLQDGENHVVGTNGINLSGGQRQRVAIARAAYAEYPLTVLDDVFSSLDYDTAVNVLHRLCGSNGLLRQTGSTVLLVTYLPECLHLIDRAIVIEDSRCSFLEEQSAIMRFSEPLMATLTSGGQRNVSAAAERREQGAIRQSLERSMEMAHIENANLRRKGSLRLYMLFIDPIGKLAMTCYSLLVSLFASGEVLPEIYVRIWIETDPDNSLIFIGYVTVVVATCLLGYIISWLLYIKLSPRASRELYDQLVDTTFGATHEFISKIKTGTLTNRYGMDMTLICRNLPAGIMRILHCGTCALIEIAIVLAGASYLAGTLPALVLALFCIQRVYLRTSRQVRLLEMEEKAPLFTYFEETATGLSHIQSFAWREQNIERGLALLDNSQRPAYTLLALQQWLALALGLLTATLGCVLVAIALFVRQSSSAAAVGLSFLGLLTMNLALENTITAWTALETSSGALTRLATLKATTPQEAKPTGELPADWPAQGQITFSNVDAYYSRYSTDRPALNSVSFQIQPGQRVGVAGRSGSGKSTLLLTLLGFLEYDGRIEIDGVNLSTASRDELRSRLVTITQIHVRFDDSIRANLLPLTMNDTKKSAQQEEEAKQKDAELERLLKDMKIWQPLADKGGLGAMLENVGYSKGQLQLLAIARAILRQRDTGSKVILVDEATSSVDARTEKTIQKIMRDHFSNCTVLTIAHRRSSLQNVDKVINLHRGSVVDSSDDGQTDSSD